LTSGTSGRGEIGSSTVVGKTTVLSSATIGCGNGSTFVVDVAVVGTIALTGVGTIAAIRLDGDKGGRCSVETLLAGAWCSVNSARSRSSLCRRLRCGRSLAKP
jgi:hypothetical protein